MKFHSFVNQDDKRTIIEIPNFFGFKEASIIDNGLTIKYSDEKISGLELLIRVLRNYCCIKQYIDNEGKSSFRKKISKHEKEICKRNIAKIDNIIQTYCTFDIEYIGQAYDTPKRPTPRSATERLIEGHKTFSQILSDFISMYRTKDIRVIQINCTPQISSAVLNISLSNAKNTAEKVFNNENAFNKKHESTIVTLVEAGLIRYFHPSNLINLYPIAPNSRLHPLKIFANPFSILPHTTTCNRYAFRIHKLPFNRGLPLQKQRQVFAKIIVIAATIFIDILPFSTL